MPRKTTAQPSTQKYYKVWLHLEVVDEHGDQLEPDFDLPFSATAMATSEEVALNIAHDLHDIGRVLAARQNQTKAQPTGQSFPFAIV